MLITYIAYTSRVGKENHTSKERMCLEIIAKAATLASSNTPRPFPNQSNQEEVPP